MEQKIYYCPILKIVKRLLNKLILTKPRDSFSTESSTSIEGSWMMRITSLEAYNSFFIITVENNDFELYTFPDSKGGGISY